VAAPADALARIQTAPGWRSADEPVVSTHPDAAAVPVSVVGSRWQSVSSGKGAGAAC
jgi:hypothetical protein